ncbi:MAG TPA: hypothetical protein GXX35_11560 [Thermoanaerobacterales bacterium]|nr:hypothetical protein [Thermoanaerobacterales bacterium]
MGAFGGLILTNKGRNLQAKAQTGVQLNFTKIKIGDGSLSGQSIVDLTNLISTKKELTILSLETLTGGRAKLRSYFTNADIVTGFYWRELGVFAQDPDEGEILYCYGNAGTNAEYIPAGGGPDVVERYINVITLVGNATNVSTTLGSEIYVTQADFDNHTGNTVMHVTQVEKDTWNAKETPAGAQAKADVAEAAANAYTDQKVGDLAGAGRTTETVKGNADALAAHLADNTQAHGLGGIPLVSTGSKTYYIDAVNGNDNNDGLTPQTAFKTWVKAEKMIPRFLYHTYTIKIIGNLPEAITLYNRILYGNFLIIAGNTTTPSNQQINGLYIKGVIAGWSNGVLVQYLRINGAVQIAGCLGVKLLSCEPQNLGGIGVTVISAIVQVESCNFGTNIVQDAISAGLAVVFSANNSGTATRYGLSSGSVSTIGKLGTQPTGTTANEFIDSGGVIR